MDIRRRLEDLGDIVRDADVELGQVPDPRFAGHPGGLAFACHCARLYTIESSIGATIVAISGPAGNATERTLERVLAREAARFGVARALPLDLEPLLSDLGIALRAERRTAGRGHGWLQRSGASWQIVVDASSGAARQRYTAAHELGHYVVEAWTGYRPVTRRDYWMLETACQRFAAELLAPREVVESCMAPGLDSSAALIAAIDRLIAATGLSLEAAARRVVDICGRPAAAAALSVPAKESTPRRHAQILWARSNQPWIPMSRGRLIRKDHPLRDATRTATSLDAGEFATVVLPRASSSAVARRQSGLVLIGALLDDVRA